MKNVWNKNTGKFNDIAFGMIFGWHMYSRQWPFGDTLQTVLDVMLVICLVLVCFKYYTLYKNGLVPIEDVKEIKTDKIRIGRSAKAKKK